MFASNTYAETTTGASASDTLTMDDLLEVIKSIPPCPFATVMEENCMPPEDGYVMLLPHNYKEHFPEQYLPSYVAYSPHIDTPVIFKNTFDFTRGRPIKFDFEEKK